MSTTVAGVDAQTFVDSIRTWEADSRKWKAERIRYGRNVLGLVAHNLLRHCDARHDGRYVHACRTCSRMRDTYNREAAAITAATGASF